MKLTTLATLMAVAISINTFAQANNALTPALSDAVLPTELTTEDINVLAQGFCQDGNTEGLTSLTLGAAQRSPELLDNIYRIVAQTCAQMAAPLMFSVNQNLPQYAMASFATLSSYLQQNNQVEALAALNSSNNTLLAQLQNQGLDVETAAGPSQMNFDTVLEALDIPTENPAQLSAN